MMTFTSGTYSKKNSYYLGVDSYLEKPFSINVLNSRINNIIESRRQIDSPRGEPRGTFSSPKAIIDPEIIPIVLAYPAASSGECARGIHQKYKKESSRFAPVGCAELVNSVPRCLPPLESIGSGYSESDSCYSKWDGTLTAEKRF